MSTIFPQVMVELSIYGSDLNLERISKSLDARPTKVRKKEEYKISQYAYDTWDYSTDYLETKDIATPFTQLVNMFKCRIPAINKIKEEFNCKSIIVIVVKAYENNTPEYILTTECIKFAADTNSAIHFDNYFFNEKE